MAQNGQILTWQMLRMPISTKEKAQAKFEEAKKELASQGVTFPIHLDVAVDQTSKNCCVRHELS